jgi:hypothetical protein
VHDHAMDRQRSQTMSARLLPLMAAGLLGLVACSNDTSGTVRLTREELMKPESCKTCHPRHYQEWASSMHAYSSDDPVFRAMNKKGQHDAQIGDFCVNCHAPMAVREGLTKDGLNLDSVPQEMKGVTCYFCHNVAEVTGDHNAMLNLANDTTMRGPIDDPADPKVHGAAFTPLMDANDARSAGMCGSCHDIVTPAGVHIERSFAEWKTSVQATQVPLNTCNGCHMDSTRGPAAPGAKDINVPSRFVHNHMFAAVDQAFPDKDGKVTWPDAEAHAAAIDCAQQGGATLFEICPYVGSDFTPSPVSFAVVIETNGGHNFPSGASHDRRAWLEYVAYDANDNVLLSSGTRMPGEVIEKPKGSPGYDDRLKMMRDHIYDASGNEVHMFWEAAPSTQYPMGYSTTALKPATMPASPGSGPPPHSTTVSYNLPTAAARVRVQFHVQPVGREVLDELAADPELDFDPALAASIPSLTLSGDIMEWNKDKDGTDCVMTRLPAPECRPDIALYRKLYNESAAAMQR